MQIGKMENVLYFLFTATGVAGAERCPSNTDDFMRSTARRGVEKSSDPESRDTKTLGHLSSIDARQERDK